MTDPYQEYLGALELLGDAPAVRGRRMADIAAVRQQELLVAQQEADAVRAQWDAAGGRLTALSPRVRRIASDAGVAVSPPSQNPGSLTLEQLARETTQVETDARTARDQLEWIARARADLAAMSAAAAPPTQPAPVAPTATTPTAVAPAPVTADASGDKKRWWPWLIGGGVAVIAGVITTVVLLPI